MAATRRCDCGAAAACPRCGGTGVLRKPVPWAGANRCFAVHPDRSLRVGKCLLPSGHDGPHSAPAASPGAGIREVNWDSAPPG